MGKKVFSLCMALALCLGLLPVTALAVGGAPSQLYVGDQQVSSGNDITYWTTDKSTGGLTKYEGNDDNWNVKYDPTSATLTLSGATIKGGSDVASIPYGAGIYAQCNSGESVSLTIELIGENTITGYCGIYVNAEISADSYGTDASLTITGESNGSLKVSGSYHGIYVKSGTGGASLNINDASVVASSSSSYSDYAGVYVQSSAHATNSPQLSLKVNGGSLTTSGIGNSDGILFYVGAPQASDATTSLTVSKNAIVDARNGGIKASDSSMSDLSDQIKVSSGDGTNGGIVFDGSTGTVYGNVELQKDLEIKSGETLTIPEGSSLDMGGNEITVASGGKLEGQPTGEGTLKIAPTITTENLTNGEVGTLYTAKLEADGDTPITWDLASDSFLPAGLSLSADGTISGKPTTANTYTFTVTATNASGSASKEYTLYIKPATVSVNSVELDQTKLNLFTGATATLNATVKPSNATNQNVTWSSNNADVATVDNGTVTAVGAGTATITVTTQDGGKTDTCTVTVEKPYTPPPYIPPTKSPSEQAIDKIEDAKEGSTVKITLRTGQTKLDKEVFEELAGRDVTLEIILPGGVTWTVNGEDIPQTADLTDLDMGVSLNTSTIPVDLINAITGEIGTVQLTLKHDGPFGFTMTLTAPVGKENEGLWANLYHYDEDAGKMVYQTSALVDEDGNVALPFDHASQYALVLDSKSHDLPFTDLAANAWYTDAVAYVYRHDIMEGMSATTFQPNGTLSRAMAVQIFYNLEGQPDISDENLGYPYEDVDAQAWYGDAVYWARITGVATGYGDGTFQPGDSITRQEFAQMLYNYAKYKGYDLTAEGDLAQFPDSGSVADWAETAMSWANGNELINGHDNGTIDAAGTAIRAQAASILMRFDQNLVEK